MTFLVFNIYNAVIIILIECWHSKIFGHDKFHAVELCFVHEKSLITFRAWLITGSEIREDNCELIFLKDIPSIKTW